MAGQCFFRKFKLVAENPIPTIPVLDLPASTLFKCCGDFSLKVLAKTGTNDEYKNDRSSIIDWFNPVVSEVGLSLWKFDSTIGDYAHADDLDDNTYGTFYAYGFFTNTKGEKFIGYQIEWKNVLTLLGAGSYIIKTDVTLSYGGSGQKTSNEFCLKAYTPDRADGTVRMEYFLSGTTANVDFDNKSKDFGNLNWYNSFRLPGFFGYPSGDYETSYIKYNDGQQPFVEDDMTEEFMLEIKPIPFFVHNILKIDFMMADSAFITDYNSKNIAPFIKKQVIKKSGYQPKWSPLRAVLSPVGLKFNPYYNNNKKFRD